MEDVATRKAMHGNDLEEHFTLQQIRLAYYLAHKSESRRMRAQARMIIEELVKSFNQQT